MPCDTQRRPQQTLDQRKAEVLSAIDALARSLASGKVKPVIGPQGAIAFQGWTEGREARVTDACAFRIVMSQGSALAKQAIARAEQLAGRTVSRQALTQGIHGHEDSHGRLHWHHGH